MFDDPTAYFYEHVVASFEDYRERKNCRTTGRSRDIRSAMEAASALFHLREHLPPPPPSRAEVEALCPDYGVLGDIVNAAKHRSLTGITPHGAPLVDSAASLSEELASIQYHDENGPYRFVENRVIATLADGSRRNVLEVLTNVINFWAAHLHSAGILSEPHVTYALESYAEPKTRAECEPNDMGLEIVQGRRLRLRTRVERYNYETGTIEPVDLTGMKARMRIYHPRTFIAEVSITHDATGVEFKKEITLSADDCAAIELLSTEAERRAYIMPRANEALRELVAEANLAMASKSGSDVEPESDQGPDTEVT